MFEIVPGAQLDSAPRLSLSGMSLTIGPYAGPEEHEKHVLRTVGSGNWYFSEYDELRFDPVTGVLQSLQLHIPERNATSYSSPVTPGVPGSLRLTSLSDFDHEPAALRCMDSTRLACLYTMDAIADRVTVAPGVDLLLTDGELAGWLVAEPERFIAEGGPSAEVRALLAEFFTLVAEPGIERMEAEDPAMLRALEELSGRVGTASPQRAALHDRLADLADFFYG
ncbi:hypothetical protein [Actinocrispum sp. NPDC049592]|uniref:hypothetical protein n=1 Tax=Actinocrispum sp. NPDC049592 TaxID=3154835 RepID=UPI003441769E